MHNHHKTPRPEDSRMTQRRPFGHKPWRHPPVQLRSLITSNPRNSACTETCDQKQHQPTDSSAATLNTSRVKLSDSMQTTMHRTSVTPGQSCSYATRSATSYRLGGRVNLTARTNGFRAVRAQKRQRLGASNRSGLNIVCEKVLQILHPAKIQYIL